jgi:16S rRNA (guanine527-N7)-methyltransferase
MSVASLIESEAQDWLRQELSVDDATMARLARLVALLVEENARQNLIARGTIPMVWQRHIVDSAQLLAVPRETLPEGPWLDLAPGRASRPGHCRAATDRPVTLVDSRRLRTEWLARAAQDLGLDRVTVTLSRVEDARSNLFRAFGALSRRWTSSWRFLRVFPHRKRCGCCQKGRRPRKIGYTAGNLAPCVSRGTIADRSRRWRDRRPLAGWPSPKPARKPGSASQRGSRQ